MSEKLEKFNDSHFELRNGLVYRKNGDDLLFYVPESIEVNVIYGYHDGMGHLSAVKIMNTIKGNLVS